MSRCMCIHICIYIYIYVIHIHIYIHIPGLVALGARLRMAAPLPARQGGKSSSTTIY